MPLQVYLSLPTPTLTGSVPRVELGRYSGNLQPYARLSYSDNDLNGYLLVEDPAWLDQLAAAAVDGAAKLRAAIAAAQAAKGGGEGK